MRSMASLSFEWCRPHLVARHHTSGRSRPAL